MDLFLSQNRIDDSLAILQTCHDLDPYNEQISQWIDQLTHSKNSPPPDMIQQAFAQVQRAIAANKTNDAQQILQQLLAYQGNNPAVLMGVADAYVHMNDMARSEQVIIKMTEITPNSSEPWYNLGVIQAHRGETAQAIASLTKSLALNHEERAKNPSMVNLREHLFEDPTFSELRQRPEFQAAFGTKP
jgi:predicted Zn-dependent protease